MSQCSQSCARAVSNIASPPETRSSSRSSLGKPATRIDITDILLAGEGSDLKPVAGLTVGAEIVAQAKADKVTVFKKRRRHNYRRKKGHRQQHTILKIVSIGGEKAKAAKPKAEAAPAENQGRLLHPRRPRSLPKAEAPAEEGRAEGESRQGPVDKGCCTC